MNTNIYYIPEDKCVSITSNFAEIQKWMNLGVNPKVEYIPITISDFSKYEIKGLGFDEVDNNYFQSIKGIFLKHKFEAISFYASNVDLSDVVLDVKHLLIGDKSKIDLFENNFKNLEEITFLDGKRKNINKVELC